MTPQPLNRHLQLWAKHGHHEGRYAKQRYGGPSEIVNLALVANT